MTPCRVVCSDENRGADGELLAWTMSAAALRAEPECGTHETTRPIRLPLERARTDAAPGFPWRPIVTMVFTYNIGNGLTAGLVLYPLVKVAAGRAGEVKGGAWALAGISAVYFVFGLPH